VESCDPKTTLKEYIAPEKRGKRAKNFTSVRTGSESRLSVKMDAFPEMGIEHLLYLALGSKGSAIQGAGPAYKHTLTRNDYLPTASFWKNYETVDAGLLPEVYTSCMCDSLSMSIKEEDALKISADFICNPIDISQTDKTPSYTPATQPWVWPQLTFKWNDYPGAVAAETRCTNFDLDIKNGVKTKYTADGKLYPGIMLATDFEVTAKLGIAFEDRALEKKWLGASNATTPQTTQVLQNIEIGLQGPLIASTYYYQYTIKLPKVLISDLDVGSGEPAEYGYSLTALDDPTNGTMSAEITSKLVSIA
jgi:hypothetical protein